jgi:hypothetical protein
VPQQPRLYFLIRADQHSKDVGAHLVLHPRGCGGDQPFDVEVVGVDEEPDHRHLIVRLVGDVGHHDNALLFDVRIDARGERIDRGFLCEWSLGV